MECSDEGLAYPRHFRLFISLTRHALYMSLEKMRETFPRRVPDGLPVLDFGLGLDGHGRFASNDDYWTYMCTHIVMFVRKCGEQPVNALLLGSENATDSNFFQTLRNALASLTPMLPLILNADVVTVTDPTFTAARGTAVYVRRRQEAPGPCVESLVCEERREKERAGGNERKLELR